MKIVFLEPINVLSSKDFRRKLLELNNFNNYDHFIEKELEVSKVKLFKKILDETESKMVLYTRERCCSQKIGELVHKLIKCGLPDRYWFDTIPSGGEANAALQNWIASKKHITIENYAILDALKNSQTSESAKNIFWADKINGLTEEIANNIITFLNSSI